MVTAKMRVEVTVPIEIDLILRYFPPDFDFDMSAFAVSH